MLLSQFGMFWLFIIQFDFAGPHTHQQWSYFNEWRCPQNRVKVSQNILSSAVSRVCSLALCNHNWLPSLDAPRSDDLGWAHKLALKLVQVWHQNFVLRPSPSCKTAPDCNTGYQGDISSCHYQKMPLQHFYCTWTWHCCYLRVTTSADQ